MYIQGGKDKQSKERIYSQRSGSQYHQSNTTSPSDFAPEMPSPGLLAEMDQTAIGIDFVLA
jgi:hypothetical protein